MRVTVILSDDEYAQVKQRAGLIPLSRWFKSLAIPKVDEVSEIIKEVKERSRVEHLVDPLPGFTSQLPYVGPVMSAGDVPVKSKNICSHGKRKGYNCGLCGGLAKVE